MKNYTCQICGRVFAGEAYRERQVCSQACKHELIGRKLSGENSPHWTGDRATEDAGRQRARKLYELPEFCERCDQNKRLERHHMDGNPRNNERENIAFLCRRCHLTVDGRLARAVEIAKRPRVSPEELAETVALYRSGLSLEAVGKQVGLTGGGVKNRLQIAGEPRRTAWETRRFRGAA